VARLNANGSLDTGFTASADNVPVSIALQANGKIVLGGAFTQINGVSRRCLARLNPDGSLDESFYPPGGADNAVYAVKVQDDGKILVGGWFQNIGGVARSFVARLHGDGNFIVSPIPLRAQKSGQELVLTWEDARFSLESANVATGPFTLATGATSPYRVPINGTQKYFRLRAD
jgi:uncharacterized delta-60 repeat protein